MRFKIVVSSKGSAGKTPLALSLTLNHLIMDQPIIAVDVNSNNPDLARILSSTSIKNKKRSLCEKNDLFTCIEITENLHLIYRSSPFDPLSMEEFWRLLAEIKEHSDKAHSRETICIVDTVFNLPSLDPSTESSRIALLDFGKATIEIFNIWNVVSVQVRSQFQQRFEEVDEIKVIGDTLRNLDRIGESDSSVIHVFTPRPYVRATDTTKIGKLLDGRLVRDTGKLLPIGIEEFQAFKEKKLDFGLTLPFEGKMKSLQAIVESIDISDIGQKTEFSFEKLENEVFRDIFRVINSWEYQRPWNVIVIPELVPEVFNIAETLSFTNELTFERIERMLSRFYQEVADWIKEYEDKRQDLKM